MLSPWIPHVYDALGPGGRRTAPPRPRTARNRVNAEKQVILMERIDKLPESPYNNFVIFIRFK